MIGSDRNRIAVWKNFDVRETRRVGGVRRKWVAVSTGTTPFVLPQFRCRPKHNLTLDVSEENKMVLQFYMTVVHTYINIRVSYRVEGEYTPQDFGFGKWMSVHRLKWHAHWLFKTLILSFLPLPPMYAWDPEYTCTYMYMYLLHIPLHMYVYEKLNHIQWNLFKNDTTGTKESVLNKIRIYVGVPLSVVRMYGLC